MKRSQPRPRAPMVGRKSLFRGKVRSDVVTLTMTPAHKKKVEATARRLGISRADVFGLLVHRYCDDLQLPHDSDE